MNKFIASLIACTFLFAITTVGFAQQPPVPNPVEKSKTAESKQDGNKKAEPKKVEKKKAEPKKEEQKDGPKKDGPKKDESKKEESKDDEKAKEKEEKKLKPTVSRRTARNTSERAHQSVTGTFKSLIENVAKSTVTLYNNDDREISLGTIVSANGEIVCKASLVEEDAPRVVLPSGETLKATRVGTNKEYDLALLKVEASNLTPVNLNGSAQTIEAGDWLVSADRGGEVLCLGIATSNPRKFNLRSPRENPALAKAGFMGVQIQMDNGKVVIQQVVDNSAAQRARFRVGDILLKVDDFELKQQASLSQYLSKKKVGDEVLITFVRGEKEQQKKLKLGKRPPASSQYDRWGGGPFSKRRFGFPTVISHDGIIKPTQVGGPIVNSDGKFVGVNISRSLRISTYGILATDLAEVVAKIKEASAKKAEKEPTPKDTTKTAPQKAAPESDKKKTDDKKPAAVKPLQEKPDSKSDKNEPATREEINQMVAEQVDISGFPGTLTLVSDSVVPEGAIETFANFKKKGN